MNAGLYKKLIGAGGVSVIIMGLGVVTGVMTARLLSPEERGLLGEVMLYITVTVAVFVPPTADCIVLKGGKSKLVIIDDRYSRSLMLICALLLLYIFSLNVFPETRVSAMALSACISVVYFQFHGEIQRGNFRRRSELNKLYFYAVLQPLVYCLFLVVCYIFSAKLDALVYSYVLSVAVVYCLREFESRRASSSALDADVMSFRQVLRDKWVPVHLNNMISFGMSNLERILALAISTSHEYGLYLAALTLASAVGGVLNFGMKSIVVGDLKVSKSPPKLYAMRLIAINIAIGTLSVLGFLWVGDELVRYVLGVEYIEATHFIPMLVVLATISSCRIGILEVMKFFGGVGMSNIIMATLGIGAVAIVMLVNSIGLKEFLVCQIFISSFGLILMTMLMFSKLKSKLN